VITFIVLLVLSAILVASTGYGPLWHRQGQLTHPLARVIRWTNMIVGLCGLIMSAKIGVGLP
jgi:hypothetical protein